MSDLVENPEARFPLAAHISCSVQLIIMKKVL